MQAQMTASGYYVMLLYKPRVGFICETRKQDFIHPFKTGSHCVAQAGVKLTILLLQPPECSNYMCVPPSLADHMFFATCICISLISENNYRYLHKE